MNPLELTFWFSVACIGYAYVGYAVLIAIAARFGTDHSHQRLNLPGEANRAAEDWPFVTVIIAAYKEQQWILARLKNAMEVDYPRDRFEVLVGCDGQEDLTGELAEAYADDRIRVISFPVRRGKASVLNDCVPQARGEIILFSDANTMMDREAVKRLARHFRDETVGGVVGRLHLVDAITGTNADGLYWKYENFLKHCEGKLGALLGANGGLYAIRKSLYQPLAPQTILDDFVIGMRISLSGSKLLYDKTATAWEETPLNAAAEFPRRTRIGAGGFQSLSWLSGALHPKRGWLAIAFWSHKIGRWLCPWAMLAALVSNAALVLLPVVLPHLAASVLGTMTTLAPLYAAMLAIQLGGYLCAGLTRSLKLSARWQKPFRLPELFVQTNLALLVGFFRWMKGIRSGTWVRTDRTSTSIPAASGPVAGSHAAQIASPPVLSSHEAERLRHASPSADHSSMIAVLGSPGTTASP